MKVIDYFIMDNIENSLSSKSMPEEKHSVKLITLVEFLGLTKIWVSDDIEETLISRTDINRPGLVFTGYFGHFEADRIQIIGNAEYSYLRSLNGSDRSKYLREYFNMKPVCTIFAHNLEVFPEAIKFAKENNVPIFQTPSATSAFMAALISKLNLELAPRITRHGVFVEVYGEGILILGESGIGKSETAIELVKRGHRLIADDAVEIKKVSAITLIGTAPELIRHYVELRGIGMVDIRRIFGMGAVKLTEKIDLVIKLEEWKNDKLYERFGLNTEYVEIMGINVPAVTIPVQPGRNLAIIFEIAAMNNRQKKMGYDTAVELNKRLTEHINAEQDR